VNVLLVTLQDPSARSGAEVRLRALVSGLRDQGFTVSLISAKRRIAEFHARSRAVRWQQLLRTAYGIRRETLAAVAERRPDIVYLRKFPADYLFVARKLSALGVPYVVEVHGVGVEELRARSGSLRGRFYALLEPALLRHCAGVVAVTEEIRLAAVNLAGHDLPSIAIGNGVDTEMRPRTSREETRAALRVPSGALVLVMAGFDRPWHGADLALRMMSELGPTGAELWLIGSHSQSEGEAVREKTAALGLADSVRVFPWLDERETATLVSAADVGLGPLALDRKGISEASPLKTRLYLSLGVPVLINYRDPELNPSAPFVEAVESSDPAILAGAVKKLFSRGDVSHLAHQEAVEKLSWAAISRRVGDFLQGIAKSDLAEKANFVASPSGCEP
jgi:glycosyltransferase involved in cell wall biosynthesis